MKKVTELQENEVIHCPTIEEFEKIIALNPENGCDVINWYVFREQTCYNPSNKTYKVNSLGRELYEYDGYTIHQAKDFLEPEFEWGEEVEVRNLDNLKWDTGFFVGMNPNKHTYWKYIVTKGQDGADSYKQCRKLQETLTLKITKGDKVVLEKEITEKEMEGLI